MFLKEKNTVPYKRILSRLFFCCTLFFCALIQAQSFDSIVNRYSSLLNNLPVGDSLTYYQCHVEEVALTLNTASGQTLSGNPQKSSVTEKLVVYKTERGYFLNYYTSSLTLLPNRKFSGLKIRERPYWNFKQNKNRVTLQQPQILALLALENKGHEAMEYDYVISKYNTNQLIIKRKKDFKQLVIPANYVLSKLLNL